MNKEDICTIPMIYDTNSDITHGNTGIELHVAILLEFPHCLLMVKST